MAERVTPQGPDRTDYSLWPQIPPRFHFTPAEILSQVRVTWKMMGRGRWRKVGLKTAVPFRLLSPLQSLPILQCPPQTSLLGAHLLVGPVSEFLGHTLSPSTLCPSTCSFAAGNITGRILYDSLTWLFNVVCLCVSLDIYKVNVSTNIYF